MNRCSAKLKRAARVCFILSMQNRCMYWTGRFRFEFRLFKVTRDSRQFHRGVTRLPIPRKLTKNQEFCGSFCCCGLTTCFFVPGPVAIVLVRVVDTL